jgi:hypothetical protein
LTFIPISFQFNPYQLARIHFASGQFVLRDCGDAASVPTFLAMTPNDTLERRIRTAWHRNFSGANARKDCARKWHCRVYRKRSCGQSRDVRVFHKVAGKIETQLDANVYRLRFELAGVETEQKEQKITNV